MSIDLDFDLKKVFYTDQKYNSIKLLESSIFENAICIKLELLKHDNKEELANEHEFINNFLEFHNKFISYEFCKQNMNTRFKLEGEESKLLKDSNLTELFQTLYDKINLVVNDLMGDIDFNPNRVTIRKKTSVFLIAYATRLKEIWERIDEKFIENLMNKNLEDKVYRINHFNEKLKVIPPANLRGAWAKGPLNFS
jgi:hypothetical protein